MTPELAGRRIAIASMLVSAGLAAAKITIGLHASSTATVSDGIESAGDVLTSGLVLLGLIIAAKPPDSEHPYGHGRLETTQRAGGGNDAGSQRRAHRFRVAPPVARLQPHARPPTPSGRSSHPSPSSPS